MRWQIDRDVRTDPQAQAGLEWVRAFMAQWNTGDVESIRFDRGNAGGRAWNSEREADQYANARLAEYRAERRA